jgi:hypothetical protein
MIKQKVKSQWWQQFKYGMSGVFIYRRLSRRIANYTVSWIIFHNLWYDGIVFSPDICSCPPQHITTKNIHWQCWKRRRELQLIEPDMFDHLFVALSTLQNAMLCTTHIWKNLVWFPLLKVASLLMNAFGRMASNLTKDLLNATSPS